MAASQREISISEFFAKNRHLLGFDNPKKALLTTIKEAVDNSMDACEEACEISDKMSPKILARNSFSVQLHCRKPVARQEQEALKSLTSQPNSEPNDGTDLLG